jgi:hypothetical protein
MKQKYVSSVTDDEGSELRKIDVLLLTHQFDTEALYISHPLIFTSKERYSEYSLLLERIDKKLQEFALVDPVGMLPMDCSNRYSYGKVVVHIGRITNFPFTNNIFIKISLGAWQVQSKRIVNDKLDWNQIFFIPTPNHFATLKVEVINLQSDGWFKEHFKEHVLA